MYTNPAPEEVWPRGYMPTGAVHYRPFERSAGRHRIGCIEPEMFSHSLHVHVMSRDRYRFSDQQCGSKMQSITCLSVPLDRFRDRVSLTSNIE